MTANYLNSSRKQFEYYKQLGERTFLQLADQDLFRAPVKGSNTVAIIVKHLWGNMMSRWTDFLTSDGEKIWRERDAEFEADIATREEMMLKWTEGWTALFSALDTLNDDNISTTVFIRNQGHTIIEAINRQLCHYAYHIGQIVYIGTILKGEEWESLSIPKGESSTFNTAYFNRPKTNEHFTDRLMKEQ